MFGKKKPTIEYPPIDISETYINGKRVVTTAQERKKMRKDIMKKNPNLRIIETKPPAKIGLFGQRKTDSTDWIDDIEEIDAMLDD